MSWTNQQKGIAGKYRAAAELDEVTYRALLRDVAGDRALVDHRYTSTAPKLNQQDFERVLARLEVCLETAVAEGQVAEPHWFNEPHYWRSRLPAAGACTNQQLHRVREAWSELFGILPPGDHTEAYLLGVLRRATGRSTLTGLGDLRRAEGSLALDALRAVFRARNRRAAKTGGDQRVAT